MIKIIQTADSNIHTVELDNNPADISCIDDYRELSIDELIEYYEDELHGKNQRIRELESDTFLNRAYLDASSLLTQRNNFTISISDLELFAWPQTFGSTNPFGPGGNSITTHTIFCFRNNFHNDCVLNLLGRWQYRKKFEPFMKYIIIWK